jgi:rhamnose utilization protein RhaD (predicted bifunctional aldolase and dehydrogenase)/NAD(P)-dependent dehydrogenase (short-subunit alcohol dehydrogenase family)
MKSRWDDQEAAQCTDDLALRVYTSRLLGQDPALVLHGGGNTSVKIRETNVLGEQEDILYVKGSGWDLATIEAGGFSPVRMPRLLGLAKLERLSDLQMANELKSNMTVASAPAPSVEAILHAIIPYTFVDHTHADALIALTNTPDGEARVRQVYGNAVVIIPYVMPGFQLARRCAERFPAEAGPHTVGMVLLNHGLFTFAHTARESYERMIELVSRAEEYLARHVVTTVVPPAEGPPAPDRIALATLRQAISETAGTPMILATYTDPQVASFVQREDLAPIAQQGPATPDHVIRTKRLPLIGTDVAAYAAAYRDYFSAYAPSVDAPLTMLDPAPRIVLSPELGMCAVGRTAKDATIAAEIYRHTMEIIVQSTALERYQALPPHEIFAVEYWDLEQAKLRRQGAAPPFAGEVGLVTGAASGIGKAVVEALLARGAAVVALDRNPAITHLFPRLDVLGVHCDVTDEAAIARALDAAVRAFGGLDMLILNAGIFPAGKPIEALSLAEWNRVMEVNLNANLVLLRETYPLLKLAPRRGRVAIIGSAAYSASKAALNQLARVAALEWGADGIRVNVLHPNAVFDTGIWTEDILRTRAASYGLSVEAYKRNNVLRVEVMARDVAALAVELCGPLFAKTTGAQIPIDGGNDRVI